MDKEMEEKIKEIVEENMDCLEDVINEHLKDLLAYNNIKDDEAIVKAREVFFKG